MVEGPMVEGPMPEPAILDEWADAAADLTWQRPFEAVHRRGGRGGRWFPGGALNASVNCLDRHLPARTDQVAIHWEGEIGDRRSITYGALQAEVVSFAEALRGLGVEAGDRVALHLGWLPETVVAMLACARLGAVHGVLPASLPADALADRLSDLQPKVLVTQDGAFRHGLIVPAKSRADEALAAAGGVQATVVVRRVGIDVAWYEGDRWYHDLVAAPRPGARTAALPAAEPLVAESDHPLLMVPLAHRRGRPTWIVHGTAGYLAAAATIHRRALTTAPDDVLWCAAEIAWIGGQSHGVYGPLACGATTVMSEGTLDVPTRSRAWEIIERYGVNSLVTTPSVVRNLRQWVDTPPGSADLRSLRLIVTLGERIDPDTRNWLDFEVGGGRALVANAWGQTELAGLVMVTPSAAEDGRPPVPDPGLEVVDENGRPAAAGDAGELVLLHPWPGTFIDVEGSPETADSWWSPYPAAYATGDQAQRGADGLITVFGRRDPVVSISGQQVSLTEVTRILEEHPLLAGVDVIAVPDERRGQALCACVVLDTEAKGEAGDELARELRTYVHDALGGLARPRTVAFVDGFPADLAPEARRRALRLLGSANPADWFTVTAAQLAAAAAATE
jgi:acetyl-CoA synthetase